MAYKGKHKSGWRIRYKIYTPTRIIEKETTRHTKEKANLCYKEADRIESFTMQGAYLDADVLRALKFDVISKEEAKELLKRTTIDYPTLRTLFPLYDAHAKKHWNSNTYKSYMATTNKILGEIGDIEISNEDEYNKAIVEYIEDIGNKNKLSNRTKNTYLDRIRQIIDAAIKAKQFPLKVNPIQSIENYPDKVVRIPRVLSFDEAKFLLEEAKKRTGLFGLFYEITIVFLFCGLRRTELKYLTYDDLLDDGIKIQPKTIMPHETEEKLKNNMWIPKTRSTRVIYIDDDIWQDKVIKKINKIPRRNKFVFPGGAKSMNSFALDSAYNDRLFKESDLSLHCLRHTFITWRIECGDPLPRVMYLAGHSNIETTMRYTHISAKKMRDIIRLL